MDSETNQKWNTTPSLVIGIEPHREALTSQRGRDIKRHPSQLVKRESGNSQVNRRFQQEQSLYQHS